MNRTLGTTLVVVGVCFLMLGMNASNAYPTGVLAQGAFNERVLWYLVSGTVSTLVGVYLLASRAH